MSCCESSTHSNTH
uniref:Uncharacterized protein n=1 Tax=Arundo donax TaxID=35708 RepID=A0A0A9AIX6_ARUDO